ncbi:phage tail protein [Burkholderia sp. LS-044]|nr:phage tail protein [Burkholderia sp. LS-044]
MSVTSASASATFTADEVVVETALGGAAFRIANFNKTINLATTGAGGMDTGSAPASGFVALYAIYNPATQATALLATNATSSAAPNVYGGANMPSGYMASALVSVWQTTSGGLLNVGSQFGRTISTPGFTVLNTTVSAASYISFSVAGAVPPNAKTCRGYQAISGNTASAGLSSNIAGSSGGVGAVGQGGTMPTNASSVTTSFPHVPLVTPQTLYYIAAASSGTLTFTVGLYEYTF